MVPSRRTPRGRRERAAGKEIRALDEGEPRIAVQAPGGHGGDREEELVDEPALEEGADRVGPPSTGSAGGRGLERRDAAPASRRWPRRSPDPAGATREACRARAVVSARARGEGRMRRIEAAAAG